MVDAGADDQLIAVPEQLRLVGCLQRATVAVGPDRNAVDLADDAGRGWDPLAVLVDERGDRAVDVVQAQESGAADPEPVTVLGRGDVAVEGMLVVVAIVVVAGMG